MNNSFTKFIILDGKPGVGKTELGKLLSKKYGWIFVNLIILILDRTTIRSMDSSSIFYSRTKKICNGFSKTSN